jgi:hypothetical protein
LSAASRSVSLSGKAADMWGGGVDMLVGQGSRQVATSAALQVEMR